MNGTQLVKLRTHKRLSKKRTFIKLKQRKLTTEAGTGKKELKTVQMTCSEHGGVVRDPLYL